MRARDVDLEANEIRISTLTAARAAHREPEREMLHERALGNPTGTAQDRDLPLGQHRALPTR